jgi:hypothetical protein
VVVAYGVALVVVGIQDSKFIKLINMKIKNIIISFFALSAIIVKAQNVNPETFPQVSGSIQDKYLYTNTGGEGKVSIKTIWDSVRILDTISVGYADFYTLITGGQLQVGRTYILTDFQTIYDQMDFDAGGSLKPSLVTKTGAVEEIWVLALAPDRIASQAYSKTYPNDKIQYDWKYNTTLVNGSPAKGRISERIDEWNNRTDYDHREIKFIRYDDGAGNFTIINDNGNASQEFLTFGNTYATNTGEIIKNNYIGDFYAYNALLGQEYSNNVIHATSFCVGNIFGIVCFNNTWGDDNQSNTWGDGNQSNTWGDDNQSNTWGDDNSSNTWGDGNYSNTWGNNNSSNTWGDNNYSNTWRDGNYSNTWGNNNNLNTWGDGNYSNTWGNNNYSNTWGDDNFSNTWGRNNTSNTWGDGNYSNTWGDNNTSNTWGDGNYSNLFDTTQPMNNKILGSNIQNKDFTAEIYMYSNDYEVKIFKASDGNIYSKYFNGTADVITLIP